MQAGCVRCVVRGRVQGVFFRASTREVARRLGLRGGVSNLPDGSVEVIACGEAELLRELQGWLEKGPPLARVESLRCEELPALPARYRPDLAF